MENNLRGYRTSEFWATIATVATIIANEIFNMGIDREAVLTIVGAVATYVLSRGLAKKVPQPVVTVEAAKVIVSTNESSIPTRL